MGLNSQDERRAENRELIEQYDSVEFSIRDLKAAYIFRIRDMTAFGIGILIKEDSEILNHIKIGDMLDLKYNPIQASEPPHYFQTEIKHITKGDRGRFSGHFLIGLSVIDKDLTETPSP